MTNFETFMNVAEQIHKMTVALSLAEDYLRVCKHNNSVIEMTIDDLNSGINTLAHYVLDEMRCQDLEAKHADK